MPSQTQKRVRKRRILSLLIVVFTIIGVTASVSFSPSLQHNSTNAQSEYRQLYRQLINGETSALEMLRTNAIQSSNFYWLEQLASLNDVPAMLALANLSLREETQQKWFTRAANLGSPQAQFKLGLTVTNPNEREAWLLASAKQNFRSAQHALANLYVMNGDYDSAEPWLELTATHFAQDAMTLANYRWQLGKIDDAIRLYHQATNLGHTDSHQYAQYAENGARSLRDIALEPPSFARITSELNTQDTQECIMRIALVAKSLPNRVQAQRFYEQVLIDDRLASIPMCFSQPVWLDEGSLDCAMQKRGGAQRMVCDIKAMSEWVTNAEISHVVVLNPSNKAYVDAGVMYLDSQDTYSVFVHELAHFAGFADEYPVSRSLARVHCEQQTAPNLIFLGDIHYQPIERVTLWQSLFEQFQNTNNTIAPARTCNNIERSAFKPTTARTFLEFHDTNYIPDLYKALWRRQVETKRHWFPVAVNIARNYELTGDIELAQQWYQYAIQSAQPDIDRETDQPTSK